MTAVAVAFPVPWRRGRHVAGVAIPPLGPRLLLARTILLAVLFLTGGLLVELLMVSGLHQRAAQQRLFDRFRDELGRGTVPVGPSDGDGRAVAAGAPVAYLEIPAIGVRQVVVEGTRSSDLFSGPGHRRDTPLPGQPGVSVVFGRRATFGGPFTRLGDLDRGSTIRVTTGQGKLEFEVIGVRREGDRVPRPAPGSSRLVLATADGAPLLPDGVLRVDAELRGEAKPAPSRRAAAVPEAEQVLGTDASRLWGLVLWLEVLLAVAVGAVWAWHRWGRAQAWVVFLPLLTLVSSYASGHAAQLLPNLL